jgi:DNA-damage-inducible protein D
MSRKYSGQAGMSELLHGEHVGRIVRDGRDWYSVLDVVKELAAGSAGPSDPAAYWEQLKGREPQLAKLAETVDGLEVVDRDGLIRLIQSIPSAQAERLKAWLVRTAVERLEEVENPELAVLRTRKLYESKGYSRRWVDKRLRGVSARHELTGEWYKRGAKESDQFRSLTNTIMQSGFGMDVEGYRRHKNLFKTGENLRDPLTDQELALEALGETAAGALHQQRDSQGFEQLTADAKDAGDVVAKTRAEIERHTGHPVVESGNHRGWWAGRRRTRRDASAQPAANPGTEVPADATSKQASNDPDVAPAEVAGPQDGPKSAPEPAGKAVA